MIELKENPLLAIVIGVAVYWFTTQDGASNNNANDLSAFSTQIGIMQKSLDQMSIKFDSLQNQISLARQDPFTGRDGIELERRLISYVDELGKEIEADYNRRFDKQQNQIFDVSSKLESSKD